MRDLLEEIRDWITESFVGKIVGLFLLFYSINTILWGLIEPISVGNTFNCNYPIYHYSVVTIFSIIAMYFLLRKKIIRTINFQSLNTNATDTWVNKGGNHQRELNPGGILGKHIVFTGGFNDQSKLTLDGVTSTGDTLQIVYNPKEHFTFYVEVSMSGPNGEKQEGWFALFYNIRTPSITSDLEWNYPIKFKVIENAWLSAKVNLKTATKKTFGKSGWRYDHIIGIKIRGTGALREISIS
jgi:hypothetical protein